MRRNVSATTIALVVDLDYTLVRLNTTDELFRLMDPRKHRVLSIIFSKLLFYHLLICNAIFKRDVGKLLLVKIFARGFSKPTVNTYLKMLIETTVPTKINGKLLSLLRAVKGRRRVGYNIITILLSASLDIIANEFKSLGFDYVLASRTYYNKNGDLVWFYDLYGKKHTIVRAMLQRRLFDKVIIFDDAPEKELYSYDGVVVYKVRFEE